jgi:N-acetylmuramoyl-L-alanine amidase
MTPDGRPIDTRYRSPNHDSRVRYLIIHFTQLDFARSVTALTRGEGPRRVSSHYLVGVEPPTIYRLVDEDRRAWHAGQSFWRGDTQLNSSSIGIEIVNMGDDAAAGANFADYPPAQIDAVVSLVRDIAARHAIAPQRILGHSDIAPQRKTDPGPHTSPRCRRLHGSSRGWTRSATRCRATASSTTPPGGSSPTSR